MKHKAMKQLVHSNNENNNTSDLSEAANFN